MADCSKCKYEVSAECVPRSLKMGFPNCYQSTITNYDSLTHMSMEELAVLIGDNIDCCVCRTMAESDEECPGPCYKYWLDWLKQEAST